MESMVLDTTIKLGFLFRCQRKIFPLFIDTFKDILCELSSFIDWQFQCFFK